MMPTESISFCAKKKPYQQKVFNTDTRKSIFMINPKINHTMNCDTFILSDDEQGLENYSKEKLEQITNQLEVLSSDGEPISIHSDIYELLKKGDVDSSNLEMILELIEDEKLSPLLLYFLYPRTKFNKNAISDLDKIYEAYSESKNLKDLIVPTYGTKQEASRASKAGDVFLIENNPNIHIKTPKKIEEMFITKDNYLKLFSPVERYAPYQLTLGDCYLVSAYDSLYQNPNSRHLILRMFAQDENNKIRASFCGYKRKYDGQVVLRDKNGFEITNVATKLKNASKKVMPSLQPKALKILELLWEKDISSSTEKEIEQHINKLTKAKKTMGEDKTIKIDGYIYTKEEIDLFLSLVEKSNSEKFNSKFYNFISTNVFSNQIIAQVKAFENFSNLLTQRCTNKLEEEDFGGADYAQTRYFILVMERYLEYAKRNKKQCVYFDALLPFNIYRYLFDVPKKDFSAYINLPSSAKIVYQKMGLDCQIINFDADLGTALKAFYNKNFSKQYCASAAIVHKSKCQDEFLTTHHSYSITMKNDKILVRNPINSLKEREYTIDEFLRVFDVMYIAKIKQNSILNILN